MTSEQLDSRMLNTLLRRIEEQVESYLGAAGLPTNPHDLDVLIARRVWPQGMTRSGKRKARNGLLALVHARNVRQHLDDRATNPVLAAHEAILVGLHAHALVTTVEDASRGARQKTHLADASRKASRLRRQRRLIDDTKLVEAVASLRPHHPTQNGLAKAVAKRLGRKLGTVKDHIRQLKSHQVK